MGGSHSRLVFVCARAGIDTASNIPTYYYGDGPATATRQLDFVFASTDLADSVCVRALNGPDEWGPGDHCRVEITVSQHRDEG